jgi:hypothetical protein
MFLSISAALPPFAAVANPDAPTEVTAFAISGDAPNLLMYPATLCEPVLVTALTVAFVSAVSKGTPCATLAPVLASAVPIAAA